MRDLIFLLFLLMVQVEIANAQVVNVERLRLENRGQGWSGSIDANMDLQSNQNTVLSMNTDVQVQNRVDSNIYLVTGKTGFVKKDDDDDIVNFTFLHFRYTHYISDVWSLEGFTQLQQNRVNGINSRWLIGVGPRLECIDSDNASLVLGLIVMAEREQEEVDSIPLHRDLRLSSYIGASYTPESADYLSFTNTTYFQPRIDKVSDFRISSDWNVEVRLRKNLKFITTFNIIYDSKPPIELKNTVFALKNGLRFTFG